MQFWVHLIANSRVTPDGKAINDYTGRVIDGLGMYPTRGDDLMLTGDKYFALSDRGLPYITKGTGQNIKRPWISGDPARSSENPGLSTLHYIFALVSNRLRRDEKLNYDETKAMTMAVISNLISHTFLKYGVDISKKPDMPSRWRNLDIVNTLDFIFGWGRWTHAQVPSLTRAPGLFVPVPADDKLDLYALARASKIAANQLGYGIADSMQKMVHLPSPPHDIRDRTGGQASTHHMATFEQLGAVLGLTPEYSDGVTATELPSWLGILAECKNDQLGPIGLRLVTIAAQQSFICAPDELMFQKMPDDRLYCADIEALIEYAEE
jgi:hypothetical protein